MDSSLTTTSGGSRPEQDPEDEFVGDDGIRWGALTERLSTSLVLALGALTAGLIELVTGLLASALSTYYGAIGAFASLPFTGWTGLVEAAWTAAGTAISGEFGIVGFLIGMLLVSVWLLLLARGIDALREGVTP